MTDHNDLSSIPTSSRSRRSSTTRSIRSTSSKAYNRQPTWKTSPLKGPAPVAASLSMVFAEPELGSPLSSAATTAAAISSSSSSGSPSERTRLTDDITEVIDEEGTFEGNGTEEQSIDRNGIDSAQRSTSTGSISPNVFPSFPPSTENVTLDIRSKSIPKRKDSWYSTLTRSKAKTAMQAASIPLPDSLPTSPPPPSNVVSEQLPTVKVEAPTPQVEHSSMFEDISASPSSVSAIPIEIASPIPIKQTPAISIFNLGSGLGSPQRQVSSTQSPVKRSWFASPPTPTPSPPKNIPSTPPPSYPTKLVEFSTPTLSQSPDSTQTPLILAQQEFSSSAVHADPSNESSTTISSVDDSVPSLPHTPPANAATKLTKSPSLTHPVALNSSASRFMLSLPLLGRTKILIPLSVGMGAETLVVPQVESKEREDEVPASSGKEEDQSTMVKATTTVHETEPGAAGAERSSEAVGIVGLTVEQDKPSPFIVRSSSPSPSPSHPTLTATAASSTTPPKTSDSRITGSISWWDYVGWTSGSAGPSESSGGAGSSKAPETKLDEAEDALEKAQAAEKEHQQVLAAVEAVNSSSQALAEAHAQSADVQSGSNVLDGSETPANTLEASTSGNSSTDNVTSAWLSPWLWYYSSTTTTTTYNSGGQIAGVEGQGTVEEVPDKQTEQAVDDNENGVPEEVGAKEQVKNDVADEEEQQLQQRPQPQLDEPTLNTITSSIISNTSGWASFFSSNKLLVKSLGYRSSTSSATIDDAVKRDENGMEVMDLDFDDDDAAAEGEVVGNSSSGRGRGEETKDIGSELSSSTSNAAAASVSRSSTPISSLVKAIPQLIVSADAKRDSGAVAPSTSNGNGHSTTTAKSGAPTSSSASSIKTATKKTGTSGSGANTPAHTPASPTSSVFGKNATSKHKKNNSSMSSSSDKGDTTGATATTTTATMTTTTTTTTTTKVAATSNTKRTASPTPSKKSLSGATPPPPNVVLPSWQDTFFTAPRNYLPPKPERYADDQGIGGGGNAGGSGAGVGGKLFGKTMKFVSGVLFNAKEDPGPQSPQAIGVCASDGLSSTTGGRAGNTNAKGKERMRELSASSLGRDDVGVADATTSLLQRERQERFKEFGKDLPKAWKVFEDAGWDTSYTHDVHDSTAKRLLRRMSSAATTHGIGHSKQGVPPSEAVGDVLRGCKRVVIIGVHGWFPGAMIRTVLGEPTGTSTKFANMMEQALEEFVQEHGVSLEKVTKIPLEGDGTIEKRVERLYSNLLANNDWVSDLHDADAIIVATHSQGSIVSTHLLDKLIAENHIITSRNQVMPTGMGAESFPASIGLGDSAKRNVQRVCCLALCGIHLGPLRYLSSSTLVGPYLQYFESTAARELFEFQNTESAVSKAYVKALENVLDHGTKMVYIASLNDQVVPIYSGLFTAVSHPLILRALYIDGDAYHSSDFLSNLLVLLLRILNSGVSDSGLLAHLSEATAGSLNGVGHSTAYEELSTFSLAVKYLFLTNDGVTENVKMTLEPFNATHEQNDYEIPWSLRDIIADERVAHFFGPEISALREAFREWHPKTSILRDLKRKLQPITRLPSTFSTGSACASKL